MSGIECHECGARHDELPVSYRLDFPYASHARESVRFERDGELAIAGDEFYILANIELPLARAREESFVWTCWFSLSKTSYDRIDASWDSAERVEQPPSFAWLVSALPTYEPATTLLKTNVYQSEPGLRPWVQLEPTTHPLAREQREGIDSARIASIYHSFQQARASEVAPASSDPAASEAPGFQK